MFERYTVNARRVIFFGRYEASQWGSRYIETEHLLLGLLREDKALADRLLQSPDGLESIRKQIEAHTTVREKVSTSVDLPLTHECKRALAYAAEEAKRLNHQHIGTGHMLLGILREEKSLAAEILYERGFRLATVREEVARSSAEISTGLNILELAHEYLKAIEHGATGETLARFFDPEVTQTEFPNLLTPHGAQRDLTALLHSAEKGQQVMASQSYTILHEFVAGNHVILEVLWEGTLAIPFRSGPPGQTLRARFAVFLEFRNGKIFRQRNYDCFDPFPGE